MQDFVHQQYPHKKLMLMCFLGPTKEPGEAVDARICLPSKGKGRDPDWGSLPITGGYIMAI